MSLTADLSEKNPRVIGGSVDPSRLDREGSAEEDTVEVTCSACGTNQLASGRALGYVCVTCGSDWRVLRCRGCRKASVVLEGVSTCPRCGHDHPTGKLTASPRVPSWLTEPDPLSVWLGGVKYLGGHAERDQPVSSCGLLLDRRGIHLRAFAELFTIRWDDVRGFDIEGPLDISERLTMTRLLALGATTWAMQVAYLTVRTTSGDAIFEVDGLGPPELHARLSRVLQGLQRSDPPPAPIPVERKVAPAAPAPSTVPTPAPVPAPPRPGITELTIDPGRPDAPIDVLVVDALWKLAHVREVGLVDDREMQVLRSRLLAHVPGIAPSPPSDETGPLLHV